MPVRDAEIIGQEQERAILALLNEPTVAKAAAAVGVNESTIYRWLREPAFTKAYRDARRDAFKHAISLTQKYTPHAVQTLVKVMADPAAGHSAKVSAATALLKFSRESIELDDLAQRIEHLEQGMGGAGGAVAGGDVRGFDPPAPGVAA